MLTLAFTLGSQRAVALLLTCLSDCLPKVQRHQRRLDASEPPVATLSNDAKGLAPIGQDGGTMNSSCLPASSQLVRTSGVMDAACRAGFQR